MEEEKYKLIKQIACGVLFTAAAALGTLYVYRAVTENPTGIYRRVQSDASSMAKDNYAWFSERMKKDYEIAKDPVGSIKQEAKAIDDMVKSK